MFYKSKKNSYSNCTRKTEKNYKNSYSGLVCLVISHQVLEFYMPGILHKTYYLDFDVLIIFSFQVSVNGTLFIKFKHRMRPEEITHLRLYGDIEPQKLEYRSKSIIIPPRGITFYQSCNRSIIHTLCFISNALF